MGGGLNGVGTTGHTGTGAPYGAPAQPTHNFGVAKRAT